MEKMKFLVKLSVIFGVVALTFLSLSSAQAFTCGSRSVMGNSSPYWGTDTGKNVNAPKGSQVRISVKGEDGCAGQSAQFQILKNSSSVKSATVTLTQGSAVSGQQGAYVLSGDWMNDLDNGDYTVKLLKVGDQVFSSNGSSNTLSIQALQDCNLTKAYPSPNGGQPGNKIKLIVEAQGNCGGPSPWKASLNVIDDFAGSNQAAVFTGSGQDISSGKAVWEWTLPNTPTGATQAPFHLEAHMGPQKVSSNPFLVTRAPCVAGQCTLAPNVPTPIPAGQDKTYSFNITNPLKGGPNDLFDIINIATQWILQISIPLAVLWILYAGFLMLTAGPTPANFKKGRDILTYTILGLAIIFIGRGFITLIVSVIQLGSSNTTPNSQTTTDAGPHICIDSVCANGTAGSCQSDTDCVVSDAGAGGHLCIRNVCTNGTKGKCTTDLQCPPSKDLGEACSKSSECKIGFKCNVICQRNGGNEIGEACKRNANPSNCKSSACRTVGVLEDGDCVVKP
jgi:hypothetical protein